MFENWTPKLAVKGIKLSSTSLDLEIEKTAALSVSPLPSLADISGKEITWKSSDTSIATVSSEGIVTAVGIGTTTIKATVLGFTAECTVTVSVKPGDLDKDNNITAYDAYKALEISVDYLIGEEIDARTILTADVNKNGLPDSEDAFRILKYSVGLIENF